MFDIKGAADELGHLNDLVHDDVLTLHVINGLSANLKDISIAVRTHDTFISFEDLLKQLLKNKAFLKRIESRSCVNYITAHVANKSRFSINSNRGGNKLQTNKDSKSSYDHHCTPSIYKDHC